jgi:hypothetical protein
MSIIIRLTLYPNGSPCQGVKEDPSQGLGSVPLRLYLEDLSGGDPLRRFEIRDGLPDLPQELGLFPQVAQSTVH